jgi:hypothetical protein
MRQHIQHLTTQIDAKSQKLQQYKQQCHALQFWNPLCLLPCYLFFWAAVVVGGGMVDISRIKPILTPKRLAIKLRIVMFLLMSVMQPNDVVSDKA